MSTLEQYLAGRLNERAVAGNLRQLRTDKAGVDFFSNDYLGLAAAAAHSMYPLAEEEERLTHSASVAHGSTGSRLLSGNTLFAEQLEKSIAAFHGAAAALLFNSGFDANMGLMACIAPRHATILYDELCHASIIDGIRLSQCARKYKFRHNDLDNLENKLRRFKAEGPVIVVAESVYSMDGDMAPLESLAALCALHDAYLVIDEAHATGIYGPQGQGLVYALGLQDKVYARVHTFGKALGCHGAAIAGSLLLHQYLINFARPFIYTTALPPHAHAAIAAAYRHLQSPGFTHQPLHGLIAYFRAQIKKHGSTGWTDSHSPIQALVTGSNERSKLLCARLQQAGMQVSPILHPTVPQGMERLRICLHIFNTTAEIDQLFECL